MSGGKTEEGKRQLLPNTWPVDGSQPIPSRPGPSEATALNEDWAFQTEGIWCQSHH